MKREQFIDDLINAGAQDDEIEEALKMAESRGEFEEAPSVQVSQSQPEPKKTGLGAVLEGAGKALSFPARALGTFRKNPETGTNYDINDQQSALFRPEINKIKAGIDKAPTMPDEDFIDNAMSTGSMPTLQPSTQKEVAKGLTEFAGSTLSDPLSYIGPAAKAISGPLKNLGVTIESSVLGKGNKSILKKNRLTNDGVAETALKENVGDSLKGTIRKIDSKFDDTENNIQTMLTEAVKNNPNAKINVDDVIDAVKFRIESGADKTLFGQTEEALKAIDSFKNEIKRYGYSGEIPVDEANQLKRIIGKKGFKKGSAPTPDTAAKEQVADIIDLALKDNIEQIVPAIKEQNAVYKKLIPIKQMAENRLPTAQSNDIFSLGNILTTGAGAIAGIASQGMDPTAILFALGSNAAYRASKSGNVAQALYNSGKAINKLPVLPYGSPSVLSKKEEEKK